MIEPFCGPAGGEQVNQLRGVSVRRGERGSVKALARNKCFSLEKVHAITYSTRQQKEF